MYLKEFTLEYCTDMNICIDRKIIPMNPLLVNMIQRKDKNNFQPNLFTNPSQCCGGQHHMLRHVEPESTLSLHYNLACCLMLPRACRKHDHKIIPTQKTSTIFFALSSAAVVFDRGWKAGRNSSGSSRSVLSTFYELIMKV